MTPQEFSGVKAITKANIYFEGKVVSHTLFLSDGSKKSMGLIFPGTFHFGTDVAERMEILSGQCLVKIKGESDWKEYKVDQFFEVPAKSGFDIEVKRGICEYVCSFLA